MQFSVFGLIVPWWGYGIAVIFAGAIIYYQYKKSKK